MDKTLHNKKYKPFGLKRFIMKIIEMNKIYRNLKLTSIKMPNAPYLNRYLQA